jgi:O-antigen/teichoic acid export membrane protein
MMICSIGDAVRNGLLGTATIKFYAGTSPERGKEVLGSIWFLALIVTGALVLVDMAFMPFIHSIQNQMLLTSIRWFGITFISSLPFTFIFWVLVAEEKYGKILWLRLVNSGSMIIYTIILILLRKMTLEAMLWCNFLTNCLTSVVGFLYGFGRVSTFFHRSRSCIMELVRYGKYTMGTNFVSRLLGSTDTNIIPFMLGTNMLAIYGVALTLMQGVEIILRTFVGTGMSGMAIAYNNGNEHQTGYIMKKYTGMLTIAFVPLAFLVFIFADTAIAILGGHKYIGTAAANIFRIYMVLALFYPLDRFIGATLDIIHKPKINLYKVLIMLAFAIVGDYTGILIFKNLYGVVVASFFTTLSGMIFGYIYLNKYLKVPLNDILSLGYSEMKVFLRKMLLKIK